LQSISAHFVIFIIADDFYISNCRIINLKRKLYYSETGLAPNMHFGKIMKMCQNVWYFWKNYLPIINHRWFQQCVSCNRLKIFVKKGIKYPFTSAPLYIPSFNVEKINNNAH